MNKQKGFSTLLGLMLLLTIAGAGTYVYTQTKVSKENEIDVTADISGSSTSTKDAKSASSGETVVKGSVSIPVASTTVQVSIPTSWTTKTKDLGNGKILTYKVPPQYQIYGLTVDLIQGKIDQRPGDMPLEYIGGSVFGLSTFSNSGVTGVTYNFTGATNYKTEMIEVALDANSHLEIYTNWKDAADAPDMDDWKKIVSSIEIK